MLSVIKSIGLQGLHGYLIHVEVDVSNGIPNWEIVGLPDISVKESKERVRIAIKNTGYEFPSRRIVVNLAPATTKKEGSLFDLPIAIGILIDIGQIKQQNLEHTAIIGELSLDGKLNKVKGVLPITIEAKKLGIKRIILPKANVKEASVIKDIQVIGINDLAQVVRYLNGIEEIKPEERDIQESGQTDYEIDFSEVKGQENVKRALEIAAARKSQLLINSEVLVVEKQ